jgi:hypothetical protein
MSKRIDQKLNQFIKIHALSSADNVHHYKKLKWNNYKKQDKFTYLLRAIYLHFKSLAKTA